MTPGRWERLSEELLRGLVHAMNNRVTALSAFAELAVLDGEPLEPSVLRQELTRLHGVNTLIGIMSSRNEEPEALEVRAVLEVALDLHQHHPRMRSVPCTIELSGAVLPVRVPRWALLRLLLIMVDDAKRAGAAAGMGAVAVHISGDESLVRARICATESLGDDAATLTAQCGGTLVAGDVGVTLELPSLLEVRRRDRAGA